MNVPKGPQSRTSLESTQTLLTTQQPKPQSTTNEQPPNYDEYYTPRARDFGDTASIAPSTTSTLPGYTPPTRRYGRFKSEGAYLEALKEFAEEKRFVEPTKDDNGQSVGLVGFYGEKTLSDYAPPRRERKSSKTDDADADRQQRKKSNFTGLGLRKKIKGRKHSSAT